MMLLNTRLKCLVRDAQLSGDLLQQLGQYFDIKCVDEAIADVIIPQKAIYVFIFGADDDFSALMKKLEMLSRKHAVCLLMVNHCEVGLIAFLQDAIEKNSSLNGVFVCPLMSNETHGCLVESIKAAIAAPKEQFIVASECNQQLKQVEMMKIILSTDGSNDTSAYLVLDGFHSIENLCRAIVRERENNGADGVVQLLQEVGISQLEANQIHSFFFAES